MEYINLLDSISPLTFLDTYGYVAWTVVRDILAWIVSIAAWVFFGAAGYTLTKYLGNMKKDEAGLIVEGSQGNIFFSALALRTGFHSNYVSIKKSHPDLSKEELVTKTTFRRAISIVLVTFIVGTFMALIGAEWGLVALLAFCFRFLTADTELRDYYYVYMDYIDIDFESR